MLESPEPVFVPQAPSIGTNKGKMADHVYRQMETASEHRTELMAQAGGGSASDYNHTKITDMNDNMREGDVAAKYSAPSNYVTEFMKLNQPPSSPMGGGYAPLAGATGIEYASQTRVGPNAGAGAATHSRITQSHAQMARSIEATGKR
jgi:hypothetical protein